MFKVLFINRIHSLIVSAGSKIRNLLEMHYWTDAKNMENGASIKRLKCYKFCNTLFCFA